MLNESEITFQHSVQRLWHQDGVEWMVPSPLGNISVTVRL
jgi:hypothetical protein